MKSKWRRRDFLELGATTTAIAALGDIGPADKAEARKEQSAKPVFHTSLCDLLGIEYPIIQAGMSGVAGPELVAAVSEAGGLGVMTGALTPPAELREKIQQIRKLTDRPFGVNLLLHTDLRQPKEAARIPDDLAQKVQTQLNRFRDRLGIAKSASRPGPIPDLVNAAFEVILEERVPVWSVGLGNPTSEMVRRCRERGIKIIAMVATVDDAKVVATSGVDAVVAQGGEAGGHRSTWVKRESREHANIGGMALIPQIVDAVRMPVIAAGGITDGRGIVAALALGASGALIGTRFIATRESGAPDFYKQALLKAGSDATTVTDKFTGLYARTLRNTFTEDYEASGAPPLPPFFQFLAMGDIVKATVGKGSGEYYPMYAGQGVGSLRDLPRAAEVVRTLASEAQSIIAGLPRRVRLA
ncbi:MAG TPA: nitronate monooxygenase [Blastocatellia bacterium]|nr:nitronate monooxygenase [Blastocatellia bacterium]